MCAASSRDTCVEVHAPPHGTVSSHRGGEVTGWCARGRVTGARLIGYLVALLALPSRNHPLLPRGMAVTRYSP